VALPRGAGNKPQPERQQHQRDHEPEDTRAGDGENPDAGAENDPGSVPTSSSRVSGPVS
jgi:hypothetical protein